MKTAKERNLNLDLIRCAALAAVLGVHYFDNSGFYTVTMDSAGDFVMAMLRMLSVVCVPFFLMLSGYLCHRKTLSRRYYLGLLRILEQYFLCALACMAFEHFYLGRQYGLRDVVSDLLNFRACGYDWYVLLYFGLFLMIPFLNLMYHGCASQRQKLVLIGSFFALSILPSLLNIYFHLYSLWWNRLFPICYYFVGAYLSEYMPAKRPRRYGLALIAALLLFCGFNQFYFQGQAAAYPAIHYDHYQVFVLALLGFLFLNSLELSALPSLLERLIHVAAELSFLAYLLSWISDGVIYRCFIPYLPQPEDRFLWILVLPLLSLVFALLLARLVHWIYRLIDRPIRGWLSRRLAE
ncbi:MAG: acyltransferase [Candidatus Limivicinus sp.]